MKKSFVTSGMLCTILTSQTKRQYNTERNKKVVLVGKKPTVENKEFDHRFLM